MVMARNCKHHNYNMRVEILSGWYEAGKITAQNWLSRARHHEECLRLPCYIQQHRRAAYRWGLMAPPSTRRLRIRRRPRWLRCALPASSLARVCCAVAARGRRLRLLLSLPAHAAADSVSSCPGRAGGAGGGGPPPPRGQQVLKWQFLTRKFSCRADPRSLKREA